MNWGKIAAIASVLAILGGGLTSGYVYLKNETVHELEQDNEIIAGKQDRLQQYLKWLEQQLIYYEQTYGCPRSMQCAGTAKRKYEQHRLDYDMTLKQLKGMKGG